MVTLPYQYPDYFGNPYYIVGWFDSDRIQVKNPAGHVNVIPAERTASLLKSLNLKPEDIPGRKVKFQWEEVE